jgi:hypothetical protein
VVFAAGFAQPVKTGLTRLKPVDKKDVETPCLFIFNRTTPLMAWLTADGKQQPHRTNSNVNTVKIAKRIIIIQDFAKRKRALIVKLTISALFFVMLICYLLDAAGLTRFLVTVSAARIAVFNFNAVVSSADFAATNYPPLAGKIADFALSGRTSK